MHQELALSFTEHEIVLREKKMVSISWGWSKQSKRYIKHQPCIKHPKRGWDQTFCTPATYLPHYTTYCFMLGEGKSLTGGYLPKCPLPGNNLTDTPMDIHSIVLARLHPTSILTQPIKKTIPLSSGNNSTQLMVNKLSTCENCQLGLLIAC